VCQTIPGNVCLTPDDGQAHSEEVAEEWVTRLRALVLYWTLRVRTDAREQMEFQPDNVIKTRRRISRSSREDREQKREGGGRAPAEDPYETDVSPLLARIYNWCILSGCRGIVCYGNLFEKHGFRHRFKDRYHILIGGHLFRYKVHMRTLKGRRVPTVFHQQLGVVNLRDVYVVSGSLCDDLIDVKANRGAWDPSGLHAHRTPRVYKDGLISLDDDEDCVLVLWSVSAEAFCLFSFGLFMLT
jgi:hypothetical protein